MPNYFKNFGTVDYRFGDNEKPALFKNISQYVDLIDQVKSNVAFYQKYTIVSGERPDTLSYELYGTPDFYWTFYLMNDDIRESGMPIPDYELIDYAKKRFSHQVITTEQIFATSFPVGVTVTGQSSGATGTVLKRNLDLGQMVIKETNGLQFDKTEVVEHPQEDGGISTVRLVNAGKQYNSVHHYEDADGVFTDIDPHTDASPSALTPITNLNRLERKNDNLKEIIVIEPDSISRVVSEFFKFMR